MFIWTQINNRATHEVSLIYTINFGVDSLVGPKLPTFNSTRKRIHTVAQR